MLNSGSCGTHPKGYFPNTVISPSSRKKGHDYFAHREGNQSSLDDDSSNNGLTLGTVTGKVSVACKRLLIQSGK